MIFFKDVYKEFTKQNQKYIALDHIDLSIKKGEIYGLIGHSGAGKSTLIRLVNLLEKPSSGKILVGDKDVAKLSKKDLIQHKRSVGMIFQHFNLLLTKTVEENIAIPLILSGEKNQQFIQKKVDELLDYVELKDKKKSYPSQLSGGQKQRVGIARALINDPKILLCDETTSALDPQTTIAILDLLKRINEEQDITILLVTHEMDVIAQIADKVAVMEQGKVVEHGLTLDIFSSPKHETTKKFVQTVLNKKFPDKLMDQLDIHHDLYRLEFLGNSAKEPVINQLIQKNTVVINILFANMREIQGVVVGNMFVQLYGKQKEVDDAVSFLISHGVRVNKG